MSLAELMVAMGIMALLTGLAVLPLRSKSPLAKANPDAVAAVLSSEIRAARLRAMSRSIPVGIVIPSQNGSRAHSQSIYVLEGFLPGLQPRNPALPPEPPPKMVRVLDFSKEYPGVLIYAGGWDVNSSALSDPALMPTIGDPLATTLEGWTKPASKDFQLVFLPDGRVTSNDLPYFDGSFHLVVAANLNYSPTVPPAGSPLMTTPPGYFKLTGVHQPTTLSIGLQGGVSSTKALVAAASVTDPGPGSPAAAPAAAPMQTLVVNGPPQVADVTVMPPPNPDLAAGFDATVRPDGFLTLVIRIVDPQGDQVNCQWNDEVVAGPRKGSFTIPPGKQSIEYDNLQGCWVASAIWEPPVDAVEGNQFRLSATVSDPLGASYTLSGNAAISVQTRNAGRFFFSDNGWICSLNGDGTGIRRLAQGTEPEVSPDGSKVAFIQLPAGDVAVMNSDGTEVKTVATGDFSSPTWSPDGLYLAFNNNVGEVHFMRLHDKRMSTAILNGVHPRWSSQDKLVYQKVEGSGLVMNTAPLVASDLFLATPVLPTSTPLTLPAPYDTAILEQGAWSSGGNYLIFRSGSTLLSCAADGSNVVERYVPPAGLSAGRSWLMVGEPTTKMVYVERDADKNGQLKMCNVNLSDTNPVGPAVVLRAGKLDGSCSWGP